MSRWEDLGLGPTNAEIMRPGPKRDAWLKAQLGVEAYDIARDRAAELLDDDGHSSDVTDQRLVTEHLAAQKRRR